MWLTDWTSHARVVLQDDLAVEKIRGTAMAFEKDEDLPGYVSLPCTNCCIGSP